MRHKIDPELKLLMHRDVGIPQISLTEAASTPLVFSPQEGERVNVLLTFKGDLKPMTDIGFEVGLTAGGITTGSIPRNRIEALAALENVVAVDAYRPSRPNLKYSGRDVNAPAAHQGKPPAIPGFDGTGVIVGIIDDGIDYRHPAFRHKDVTQSTRILKLWIGQSAYNSYNINKAMTVLDESEVDFIPVPSVSHGSHVACIAAGSDDSFERLGMAPGADLMIGDLSNDLAKSIDDIVQAASTLGKRVVINLSLGSNGQYPCDANPKAQLIQNYLDAHPDVILVASAGNSGAEGQHLQVTMNNGACEFPFKVYENDTHERVVYFWYAVQESFTLRVTSPTGHSSIYIAPNTNDVFQSDLTKILPRGLDLENPEPPAPPPDVLATAKISGAMTVTQPSQLCRLMVSFKPSAGAALPAGNWTLKFTGTVQSNPIIHGWVDPDTGGSALTQARFVGGDSLGTMENPALVESVIAVGAYNTSHHPKFPPGPLAFLSSQGPLFKADLTPDTRIKPEITAPGLAVIAARSEKGEEPPYNWSPQYTAYTGTSMASPHVAGAIALLLQKEPTLTRQQVRDRLLQSARKDSFTGQSLPDFKWGYGKLDVWKLLHPNIPVPAKAEPVAGSETSVLGTLDLAGSDTDA